jgi:hypothetical protein
MKHSPMTRKTLVLEYLRVRKGQWVDGPELANERVGGSEGLKRLRELRQEGHSIEMRRHPDPRRAVHQYRLTAGATSTATSRSELPSGWEQLTWVDTTYQVQDAEELVEEWQKEELIQDHL